VIPQHLERRKLTGEIGVDDAARVEQLEYFADIAKLLE